EGKNDYLDSAYFRPAMTLYARHEPEDVARAAALLDELITRYPSGALRLGALFWSGRLAQEAGDDARARARFETVISKSPYDYYPTRARMHLRLGDRARTELWPDPGTREALREAYRQSTLSAASDSRTPYHARIWDAVTNKLYAEVLGSLKLL